MDKFTQWALLCLQVRKDRVHENTAAGRFEDTVASAPNRRAPAPLARDAEPAPAADRPQLPRSQPIEKQPLGKRDQATRNTAAKAIVRIVVAAGDRSGCSSEHKGADKEE